MNPSIACTALLACLLACSHGIEQQVRRQEQNASDSLFTDHKDYGTESRQSYPEGTLPPTTAPVAPTPAVGPTVPVTPTPAVNLCESCGDINAPFDFAGFKSDLEAASTQFIEDFTAKVLNSNLCEPDNSPSCLQTLEDHRASLDGFRDVVDKSLSELDTTICEQNIVGPITPQCPLNGIEVSVATRASDGRKLTTGLAVGIEGDVMMVIERGKFWFCGYTSTEHIMTKIFYSIFSAGCPLSAG
jgi:hypothetical protein